MTLMTVRFMFPNVLAEPPSTIKIGLPSRYRARRRQRSVQGRMGLLGRPVDPVRRPGHPLRAAIGLHAPRLPAQLAGRRAEIQVSVPRQRFLHHRESISRARRPGRSSDSRCRSRTTARSWSTRARRSSKSWVNGLIRIASFRFNLDQVDSIDLRRVRAGREARLPGSKRSRHNIRFA